jgi:hypothetical protein
MKKSYLFLVFCNIFFIIKKPLLASLKEDNYQNSQASNNPSSLTSDSKKIREALNFFKLNDNASFSVVERAYKGFSRFYEKEKKEIFKALENSKDESFSQHLQEKNEKINEDFQKADAYFNILLSNQKLLPLNKENRKETHIVYTKRTIVPIKSLEKALEIFQITNLALLTKEDIDEMYHAILNFNEHLAQLLIKKINKKRLSIQELELTNNIIKNLNLSENITKEEIDKNFFIIYKEIHDSYNIILNHIAETEKALLTYNINPIYYTLQSNGNKLKIKETVDKALSKFFYAHSLGILSEKDFSEVRTYYSLIDSIYNFPKKNDPIPVLISQEDISIVNAYKNLQLNIMDTTKQDLDEAVKKAIANQPEFDIYNNPNFDLRTDYLLIREDIKSNDNAKKIDYSVPVDKDNLFLNSQKNNITNFIYRKSIPKRTLRKKITANNLEPVEEIKPSAKASKSTPHHFDDDDSITTQPANDDNNNINNQPVKYDFSDDIFGKSTHHHFDDDDDFSIEQEKINVYLKTLGITDKTVRNNIINNKTIASAEIIENQFQLTLNKYKNENVPAVVYYAYSFLNKIYPIKELLHENKLKEAYHLLKLSLNASKKTILEAKKNIISFIPLELQKEYLDACEIILEHLNTIGIDKS